MASLVRVIYLFCVTLAAAAINAPTSAPTAAPTSAPTAPPEPEVIVESTNSTTAAPSSSSTKSTTTTPYLPKSKISFKLSLKTTATCADVTEGSRFYVALQAAGATLAGNVSKDAVVVKCSPARRLLGGRRLAALTLDFEVTVPTTEALTTQTALAELELATVAQVFAKAAADAGDSYTITVSQASLDSMKASVVTEAIPAPGSNATNASSTTTDAAFGGESSSAAFFKPSAVLLAAAIVMMAL
eukprot:TRINITY_DN36829_c0_g1_i1.p1 TRINITY_DN36829_c0_g1~~TRINITY_DN36829_c0_g1_i1.p1  ORF type:complete len:244 (-),score=63.56 TRINITY_DN36829_c0_g1_i1:268-999(-)